ncbi:MAG TPA: hypothetical protein VKY74_17905, partial [Chloroflexia bacterium]|nr:hypothetical protein [Chloroflexia bacterium]
TLTYLALGVLAGGALPGLLAGRAPARRVAILAGVLALLLLDLPLYPRTLTPFTVPPSLTALARDPAPGAVLEMPFTQHDWVDSLRMGFQIAHGRPITSGYLSRAIFDPYADACSPLQVFNRFPASSGPDIVAPSAAPQMAALLAAQRVGFVVVYKQLPITSHSLRAVPPAELAGLQALAGRLGPRLTDDALATAYRVAPAPAAPGPFLQLGPDWHAVEQSAGAPFRWMDGAHADLCLYNPGPVTAPLTFQVTSFGRPRHLQVGIGTQALLDTPVPADGTLHALSTPAVAWPAGYTRVRLVVPEGSSSPAALGQGRDARALSLGFAAIRLGAAP